jgi:rhamnosyltransferase
MQLSPQLISKDPILAIIVTFNPQLEHLYEFVIKLSKQFSSILIIDNNSDNYTEIFNKVNFTNDNCKIIFLKNTTNIGLASAQNQGAKYVLDNSYQAFCIFDQDSDIKSDYLNVLINDYNLLVSQGIQVGAIGPCVVDKSTNFSYPISIYKGMLLNRKLLKINEVAECSFIISSGSLITTRTLKEVGFFLDILFINYIDIEWCFRAIFKGYKVYTTNNTIIIQDVGIYRKVFFGRAIPVHNPIRRYYAARNSVIMLFLSHVSVGYKVREIFFNPMRLIFDCIVAGNFRNRILYFIKGIYHGFRHI